MRSNKGGKWIYDKKLGKCVPYEEYHKQVDAPFVHQDTIDETESMATAEGRKFTSMSKLKAHYKEHGYEMTGGDHLTGNYTPKPPKADREAIRNELLEQERKIKWGMAPISEQERQRWKEEERQYQAYKRRRES